jgi:hypothetical protein
MPIPHATPGRTLREGCAAYLDVLVGRRELLGGLLLLDAAGRPLEFVHNRVELPDDPLWPPALCGGVLVELVHSLFAGCRREPDLVACLPTLGSAEFLREELAPVIPFALVERATPAEPASWSWLNEPPLPAMRAARVAAEVCRRGLLEEPFERLALALGEVYGEGA